MPKENELEAVEEGEDNDVDDDKVGAYSDDDGLAYVEMYMNAQYSDNVQWQRRNNDC